MSVGVPSWRILNDGKSLKCKKCDYLFDIDRMVCPQCMQVYEKQGRHIVLSDIKATIFD